MSHFSTICQLRYHEVDQYGCPRIPALMTWLQDTAILHTKTKGLQMAELLEQGVTFVLSRLHIELNRYPASHEEVAVDTWIAQCDQRFMVRDYRLSNTDGTVIGVATTSLSMICIANRMPVNLDDFLPVYPCDPVRALEDSFDTLPELQQVDYQLNLPVLRADLDRNDHVNNTIYASWALEALPEKLVASHRMTSLEIRYRSEARYGETVVIEAQKTVGAVQGECRFLHRIISGHDQRELARLVTLWVEKSVGAEA